MRRDKEGRSCDADISLFSCPASIRSCPSFLAKRRSAVRKIMAAITLHSCEERASERAKRLYAGNGAVAVSVFMCTVLQFCFSAFLSLSLSLSLHLNVRAEAFRARSESTSCECSLVRCEADTAVQAVFENLRILRGLPLLSDAEEMDGQISLVQIVPSFVAPLLRLSAARPLLGCVIRSRT